MDYQSKTIMRLRAELRAAQEEANRLAIGIYESTNNTWGPDQLPYPHAYPPIDAKQRADQIAAGQMAHVPPSHFSHAVDAMSNPWVAKAKEQTMATATTHDDVRLVVRMIHGIEADEDIEVTQDYASRSYTCGLPPSRKGPAMYTIPERVVLELLPVANLMAYYKREVERLKADRRALRDGNMRLTIENQRLKAESGPGISSYEYKGRTERVVACQGDWMEDHEG